MKKRVLAVVLALVMLLPMAAVSTAWAAESATYEVSDYSDTVPTKEGGYVFAGWYTDDTFTTPYTEATGTATAKFVSQDVLSVKYQINSGTAAGDTSTRLRLVTTVDSLAYQAVGFTVQWEGEEARTLQTTRVYRSLTGYDDMKEFNYIPSNFHADSQYFCAYNFTVPNEKFATGFTVTPFWITADGKTVEGVERTIYVNQSSSYSPKATVTGYKLTGTWATDRVKTGINASLAPDKSYDGNTRGTCWNPAATDYASGEGIIYTLDRAQTLTKVKLTFKTRMHWFTVFTSPDGSDWTEAASVTAENYSTYYSLEVIDAANWYTCTIPGLQSNVGYIKIVFSGVSSFPENLFINFYEAEFFGRTTALSTDNMEDTAVTISDCTILGTWTTPRTNGGANGPQLTYDGDTSTKWNPESKSKYTNGEGIRYTLSESCDLSKAVLTFSTTRYHYFDLLVSADGENYTLARSVRAANYASFYETVNSMYVCTIDDLNASSVQYVEILFTGSSTNGSDEWVNFLEVGFTALKEADTREEVAATITAHELSASGWSTPGTANIYKTYDGNTATLWNPCASSYNSSPSVVYTLDGMYNLTGAVLTFSNANGTMYFTLSVSADGETFNDVLSVTSANAADYYDSAVAHSTNALHVCTISGLNTEVARYVKITFVGRYGNSTWVNFNEIAFTGKVVPDTREEVAVNIEAHDTSVGTWTNAGATGQTAERSYDGNTSTGWNAAVSGTSSAIVYTLDDTYNLTEVTMDFRDREMYFDLYVSTDGETWTLATSVTSSSGNYTDSVCTVSGLNTASASYVKIQFTGHSWASAWFTLYEITLLGKKSDGLTFTVSGVFSSNMVLQRGEPISVWGWGSAGSRVNGTFMGEKQSAVTDSDGKWRLTFSAHDANTAGQTMTVSCGDDSVTFTDVLIGDVYIVNGQSNAELAVYRTAAHLDDDGKAEVKERFRHDDGIRIFLQTKSYVTSHEELWATPQENVINSTWQWRVAAENDNFWTFSALGMYFAKNLRESVAANIPIGLIQTAAGGAFLDELSPNELNEQFGYTTKHAVTPGGYYNTMLHPFVGFPISGMLFYQGESNSGWAWAATYARDLSALVTELRTRWGDNFPFYNVQLSSHGQDLINAHTWLALPLVRSAQYQLTNTLPNYYVTVSMDVGYGGEEDTGTGLRDFAHPKNKKAVADRVAMQARKTYYGESLTDAQAFSPAPVDVSFDGTNGVTITFANVGTGLTLAADTGTTLVGFRCVIDGESVEVPATIVGTNQVKLDVDCAYVESVGYGTFQLAYPENANLCNSEGLPAPAFLVENPNEVHYTKVFIRSVETTETGYTSLGASGYTPEYCYDGDMGSKWNPNISSFAAEPGITYTLNTAADIHGVTLTFGSRREYFTLYTSANGEDWTQVAQVTSSNYADYYTDYVCTVDGLSVSGARYVKLVFNGSSDGGLWVNFFEIAFDAAFTA